MTTKAKRVVFERTDPMVWVATLEYVNRAVSLKSPVVTLRRVQQNPEVAGGHTTAREALARVEAHIIEQINSLTDLLDQVRTTMNRPDLENYERWMS